MKLFGQDTENKVEQQIGEQNSEPQLETVAAPVAAATELVLDIDGDTAEPLRESETVQDLRGATKTLPGQEKIMAAVEAAAKKNEAAVSEEKPLPEVKPASEEKPVPEGKADPVQQTGEPLSSVSYASVAQAMVNAKKEPTGRFDRDAVDDETLLAELYALIGDRKPKDTAAPAAKAAAPAAQTHPVPRPEARITQQTLQEAPEEFEEIEEDTAGVPGWLKGAFILLISLLLSAMTFYAVASDVLGEIF